LPRCTAVAGTSPFWKRFFLLVAFGFAVLFALTPAARANTTWLGDYETGSFSQWSGVQALAGRATTVTGLVRHGTYAARYEVRPGDDPIGASGERAEAFKVTGENAGTESWWGWSTYFGDDFNANPNTFWNIFTQWHHNGCCGQANAHFEVDTTTSTWGIQLRTFGGSANENERTFRLADFQRNVWYDFVFHVRWAADGTGFVEVWLNGERVLPLTNTPTIYSGQTVYVKQGFYRGPNSADTSVIYHDAVRRGHSYDDVSVSAAEAAPTGDPTGEAPPEDPSTGETAYETASEVKFAGRPRILPRKRIRVAAAAEPGSRVVMVARTRFGRLLAAGEKIAGASGEVTFLKWMPRWRLGRMVRVSLGDGSPAVDNARALRLAWRSRPRVLSGKRIRLTATAAPGAQVVMVVRNRFGQVLASARRTANEFGYARFVEHMPGWGGRRSFRVMLAATYGERSRRTLIPLQISLRAATLALAG
jgi:hypothetical protein